ncbi:MAG: sugar ABC transporter permease [Chloroflexota bacterium]|nr:sugar ABC transporter permease [Chloroflexota bacterium]
MQSARVNVGGPPGRMHPVAARERGGVLHGLSAALEDERTLGYALVAPVVLILLGLVAYPLFYAIQLSLMDRTLGNEGKFVGFDTILGLWNNSIYRQALRNTIIFTIGATILKLIMGLGVALLINEAMPFRKLIRAAILLPWIVPTVLSGLAW